MAYAICQSCAMPLIHPSDFGTNADGSPNADYCVHCMRDGAFTSDPTMDQMIEFCVPLCVEYKAYPDAGTARSAMRAYFPTLKRWRKT